MRHLEKLLTVLITALFGAMVVLVTLQIVNRYGARLSIPWTEELTRVAYILLIFIGSALAVLRNGHIRVQSIVGLLRPRLRRWLGIASDLASAAFFGVVAYGTALYAGINMGSRFPTAGWLSVGVVMAIVATVSVLIALLFLWRAISPDARHAEHGSEASQ